MPVNKVLEATPTDAANAQTRALIEKWGTLHAGRSALGDRGDACLSVGDPLASACDGVLAASDILFERRGAAGIVTLNRPKALNAVTHEMVRALARQLDAWADDAAVTRVIITAAGERAFSAGGDIRALYELGRAGRQAEVLTFWRDEYPLNTAIKRYPQAVRGADRRHRDGRRRRRVGARLASRRGRPVLVRDAGGRHRLLSRCRRDLVAAAHAGRARHVGVRSPATG